LYVRKVLVAGHVGVGHTYSHGGLVQDDSLGFSAALGVLRTFYDFDTTVRRVRVEALRSFCVETACGGVGCATPRGGLTVFEAELLKNLEGLDSSLPHLAALKVFGRVRGGGCAEVPTVAEYALSTAALDTVAKSVPGFVLARVGTDGDVIGGLNVDLPGGVLSVVVTVNGSGSGVGPAEDLEGNVPLGLKRQVMELLGCRAVPAVVLESKAFIPALASRVRGSVILLRYNRDYDNVAVAKAIARALSKLGVGYVELDNAFPRYSRSVEMVRVELASRLGRLASALGGSTKSSDKVLVSAELARVVCEDLGGVFFMSEDLAEVVGPAGLVPGTGAVVSVAVGEDYLAEVGIPYATREDAYTLARVALASVEEVLVVYEEAVEVLRRRYVDPAEVLRLE